MTEISTIATTDVVVAVLTYRRTEQLLELLPYVVAQAVELEQDGFYRTRVLVVDNDPQAGARDAVLTFGAPVDYVHEPLPGIAAGRARAITEAGDSDVVVFIDDDERPMPGWLSAMVDTWQRFGRPAGVVGRVAPVYDGIVDPWIAAGQFFQRRSYPTGTPVRAASSANLLLDLGLLRDHGLNFDRRLGLRGGEDTLLTQALTRRGDALVWCDEAGVIDLIPPSRMDRRWVLRRAFSHGAVSAQVDLAFAARPALRRSRLTGEALARMGMGLSQAAAGVVLGRLTWRARGMRKVYRGAGVLNGAVGRDVREYARSA